MIATAIKLLLTNLPIVLLAVAVVVAALIRGQRPYAERLLGWVMLLPIGVTGLWAGVSHIFFAQTSAAYIGWEPSPFQFEVGMADLAIGITGIVSFWRGLEFKAAAITAASIFLLGDAIGHVHQMIAAGNFATGNAGAPFFSDVICPVLAIVLWFMARRQGGRSERVVPAW